MKPFKFGPRIMVDVPLRLSKPISDLGPVRYVTTRPPGTRTYKVDLWLKPEPRPKKSDS